MTLILALLAVSAPAAVQPAAATPTVIPDSAARLVPVTLPELRHFADALAAIAARAGVTPNQVLLGTPKLSPAERDEIIRAHALSPARFDYIGEQVRYNDRMQQVVREELATASNGMR